jgi:hypothetical protein
MFDKFSLLWHWMRRPHKTADSEKPLSKAAINTVLCSVPPGKVETWEAVKREGRRGHLFKHDLGHSYLIAEFQAYPRTETLWDVETFVQFIHKDLEAVYKQIMAPDVPIDAPIAVKSTARRLLTKDKLIPAIASSMTEIEEWAATVSPHAFIDAAAKRELGEQPHLQVWHFVGLAQTGNVEKLRIYKSRFERGERAGFPSFITANTVQRAIDVAGV